MENFKELNENELDSIIGGAHIYVDKSHPVTGLNGRQGYRVFSCNTELAGDWKKFLSGEGAKEFSSSVSISRTTIPVDKYDLYIGRHQSDKIHEF